MKFAKEGTTFLLLIVYVVLCCGPVMAYHSASINCCISVLLPWLFLSSENQGTDSARQTMVLISQQLAGQYSYRVAIRKHNLIVQQPYALEATLDCLRPYESENISSEILRRASKVKWYADGVRIRRTASQQVLYHLSGHKKATLVIQIPDDRVTSDEVSGRYRCDIYKKGEVVLQRTYDIRYCKYYSKITGWIFHFFLGPCQLLRNWFCWYYSVSGVVYIKHRLFLPVNLSYSQLEIPPMPVIAQID